MNFQAGLRAAASGLVWLKANTHPARLIPSHPKTVAVKDKQQIADDVTVAGAALVFHQIPVSLLQAKLQQHLKNAATV